MAQILNGNGVEQAKQFNENGTRPVETDSKLDPKATGTDTRTPETKNANESETKTYLVGSDYNDQWLGWDGPVWCSRYGRFENQEDASVDDGYTVKGQPPHQNLGLERCEKHSCGCNVPFQHRSYVRDIQRRVEPMVASLVRLEQQVATLIHHLTPAHEKGNNNESKLPPGGGFAARYDETTVRHAPESNSNTTPAPHSSTEPMKESFHKLEARVESLVHQMHQLMHHQGHHVTEKEPIDPQGERQYVVL